MSTKTRDPDEYKPVDKDCYISSLCSTLALYVAMAKYA